MALDELSLSSPATSPPSLLPGAHSLERAAQTTRVALVFFLLEFAVLWLLCAALVVHLRFKREAARRGDDAAARKIILPAFEPLLIVLAVFNGLFVVFMAATLATGFYDTYIPPVVLETLYSAHQFGFVAILVFMLQKSVSLPALWRAMALSLVLSGYTIPYIWAVTTYGDPAKQLTYVKWLHPLRALWLVLSVYVFVWPPGRASKRTLRELAVYNIVRYALTTVHMVLIMDPATRAKGEYVLYVTLVWIAFNPLVIWRVLKADTAYWRGMGERACALQDLFKQRSHMHEGVSSQGLHVLIELHRKYIIDFSHLSMRQQIGIGMTSTVFRGTLKSRVRVAIKVYQPASVTEEVIAGFSHEAALCGLLHHPNVVTFFGMCVSPPAVCLVFELCQGSLEDVMRVNARRPYEPARQQLLISVGYMLDAARAVAYLHSFSPPFIHRDLKPCNFLVDVHCNVKLSDFGESRTLAMLSAAAPAPPSSDDGAGRRYAKAKATSKKVHRPSTTDVDDAPGSTSSLNTVREDEGSMGHMTVKGTADYMAPEVISGRGGVAYYDQAADVYSLAITLWDILNPGADKFPSRSHLCVFDMVLRGVRPALDPSLPASLRDVIQRAWQPDPRLRPSALAVIAVLEGVQEALSAAFIVDVMDELQPYSLQSEATVGSGLAVVAGAGGSANRHFLGIGAADMLVDHKYVNSHVEAARMGNAWMDAGLLHHAKHARAFEPSGTAVYYFAVDSSATLREAMEAACQPEPSNIPILSGPQHHHPHPHAQRSRFSNSSSRASSFSVSGKRIRAVEPCSCKRYAQRTLDESGWYNFRRKQPSAAARARNPDDMVLTTALLMDSDDDLDAFVAGGGSHA